MSYEFVFLKWKILPERKPGGHRRAEGEDDVLTLGERCLARRAVLGVAPEVVPGGAPHVPAFHFGEAHLPVEAAIFAVGHHRQAERFLALNHLADRPVLGGAKLVDPELPLGEAAERVLEMAGPQQASDVVDARRLHGLDDTIIRTS